MGKEAIVNTEKAHRHKAVQNTRQEAMGKEAIVNTEKALRH